MRVAEIFNSLQGEEDGFGGQGLPTTFIRLQGCNLNCYFCDTPQKGEGMEMDVEDVAEQAVRPKVTITGGEPLLQMEAVIELVKMLLLKNKDITIETNGSIPIPPIPRRAEHEQGWGTRLRFVVDYKLPSSGMEKHMKMELFEGINYDDVIKFVIANTEDYSRMRQLVLEQQWVAKIAISPKMGTNRQWPVRLAEMLVLDGALEHVRYSLQLHKIVGVR